MELELETSPTVFQPTSTSQVLAKIVDIPPDADVLDVGCGIGILAIYAALKGAKSVYAVDIMEEACDFARRNAERNNVSDRVHVYKGDLFQPLPTMKFDVIIDDVSGIADEVARLSPWFPEPVPTGGFDGAEHVVKLLSRVSEYLKPKGMLYLPVASLSNANKILEAAKNVFGSKIEQVVKVDYPLCAELKEQIHKLAGLRDQGIIDFTSRRSRHFWSLQVYRAWL